MLGATAEEEVKRSSIPLSIYRVASQRRAQRGLTIVEALSPRGLDNITIPMAAWYFLYLVSTRRDDPAIMISFYAAVWIPFLIGLRTVLKTGRATRHARQMPPVGSPRRQGE